MTVDELTKHYHRLYHDPKFKAYYNPQNDSTMAWQQALVRSNRYGNDADFSGAPAGANQPHNNLQTSKAVYIWLRTA